MSFIPKNLSQRDPEWMNEKIGFDEKYTIGSDGCALACLTMLVNGYGFSETPSSMNRKLKELGSGIGFLGGLIVWPGLTRAFPKVAFKRIIVCRDSPAPMDEINGWLDSGRPLLIEIARSPSPGLQYHWVLLYARQGEDYLMLDPWSQPPDTLPALLLARYGLGENPADFISAVAWYDTGETLPPAPAPGTGLYLLVQDAVMSGLRLRSSSDDANTIAIEPPGTRLLSLEPDSLALPKIGVINQWLHVRDPGGVEGFVAAWYLEKEEPPAPPPASPPASAPRPIPTPAPTPPRGLAPTPVPVIEPPPVRAATPAPEPVPVAAPVSEAPPVPAIASTPEPAPAVAPASEPPPGPAPAPGTVPAVAPASEPPPVRAATPAPEPAHAAAAASEPPPVPAPAPEQATAAAPASEPPPVPAIAPAPEPITVAAPASEPPPGPAPAPEPVPAPALSPEPPPGPAPAPEPVPALALAPEPPPGPVPVPGPVPASAAASEPPQVPAAAPMPEPVLAPAPTSEPPPGPAAAPAPEPVPAAAPASEPPSSVAATPAPEPVPSAAHASEPPPGVTPVPAPEPVPAGEQASEPSPGLAAAPAQEPISAPAPVPAPEPAATPAGLNVLVSQSIGSVGLRLRDGPSTNSNTLVILSAGAELAVLEPADQASPKIGQVNQWLYVRDEKGNLGYVAAWYVRLNPAAALASTVKPMTVLVSSQASAGLRLRDRPSVYGNILEVLMPGTLLVVLEPASTAQAKIGVVNQWLNVKLPGGMAGYVAAWYLTA